MLRGHNSASSTLNDHHKKKNKVSSKVFAGIILLCVIVNCFVIFIIQRKEENGETNRRYGWSSNKNDTDLVLLLQKQQQQQPDAIKNLYETIAAMRQSDQRALLQRFSHVIESPHETLQQPVQEQKQNQQQDHQQHQQKRTLLQEVNYGSAYKEGDKSEEYALLRREYDALLPVTDIARMKDFVQSLKKNTYSTARPQDLSYDIYNCPDEPPDDYPLAWNVLTVLKNWEIDDPTPREQIYQGVCVFDYDRDYDKALNYQNTEVPFVVQNDPRVLRTVERWNQPDYIIKLLGNKTYKAEYSSTNHFMYWKNKPDMEEERDLSPGLSKQIKEWKPPTEKIKISYSDWLKHATTSKHIGPNSEHWYFFLNGCGSRQSSNCERNLSEYLFDELDFFRADLTKKKGRKKPSRSMYIVEPSRQAGIHCRFGMKGVVAENHYDAHRNVIAVLGGERRYLLAHPREAKNMELYPEGHPSARHSAVDWSKPDLEAYPRFEKARVNEVVLQAGDVLYLPTNWFHTIVSLNINYQCNTRSGRSTEYDKYIRNAGFHINGE